MPPAQVPPRRTTGDGLRTLWRMLVVLGYGAFKSTEYWAMLAECLPHFLNVLIPTLVLYGAATAATEWCRYRTLGIWVYMGGIPLLLPSYTFMGKWGPAHVALDAAWLALPLLFVVVVVKAILLDVGDSRRKRAAAAGSAVLATGTAPGGGSYEPGEVPLGG